MTLTIAEWDALKAAAHKVWAAKSDFDNVVLNTMSNHSDEEKLFLVRFLKDEIPLPYDFNCQRTWVGGDSSDPKNHKLREPSSVPFPKMLE